MLALFTCIVGTIPSELCGSTSISVDVDGTAIHCYAGCLTSSAVSVTGASSDCHDGRIIQQFMEALVLFLMLVLPLTAMMVALFSSLWKLLSCF